MANDTNTSGVVDVSTILQGLEGGAGGGEDLGTLVDYISNRLANAGIFGESQLGGSYQSDWGDPTAWETFQYDPGGYDVNISEKYGDYSLPSIINALSDIYSPGGIGAIDEGGTDWPYVGGMRQLTSLLQKLEGGSLTEDYRQGMGEVDATERSSLDALLASFTRGAKPKRYEAVTGGSRMPSGVRDEYLADVSKLGLEASGTRRGVRGDLESGFYEDIAGYLS